MAGEDEGQAPTTPRPSATGTAPARACSSPTSRCRSTTRRRPRRRPPALGHTHGGQLWPGNLIAGLANPTVAGLERYGDTQLVQQPGAGAWGPPTRVGAESDVTVIELASLRA
ncbi:hypothetical protein LV779_23420 [Streptomyces thinghirensis]|nr:hypothetical protein [Streptomyces thinghirensis]